MSEKLTVKNVVNINKSTLSSKENWSTLNYLDTGNITENQIDTLQIFQKGEKLPSRAKRKVEKGTIIYSTVRPNQKHFGYFDTYSDDLVVSTGFATLDIIDPRVNSKYLYYLLTQNSVISQLQSIGENSTSSYPSIRPEDIGNLSFMFPDIDIQNKIADILTSIDKKIQINNQINQELEAMAKTLYDYWFVQFDFPDQNGKPYKSSGGKMVYNPELKREIPEGWGVEKLGDISQYVSEKVDSFELNIENYVGTDNMIADMGGIELTTSIPKSGTSTKFSAGDILISNIRPYFKKIWLSDRTGGCSADVLCIRTNRTIPKEFVYATLARDDFFNYDVAGSKGSKMPRGDKKHIMEYPIVFEFGVAEQYSKIVRPIYEAVHENNNQNQELTKLRDWLLPMLMNGQVKVE